MTAAWYAAFTLVALLALINAVFLIATMRQVGVLHERVKPTGAGDHEGPGIGRLLPILRSAQIVASQESVSVFARPITLLAYVTPGCGLCDELLPALRAYQRTLPEESVEVLLVTDVGRESAVQYVRDHRLSLPFLLMPDLATTYELPGSPYVLAVRRESEQSVRVLAGGVVNTLEQLEDVEQLARDNASALIAQGAAVQPEVVQPTMLRVDGSVPN